MEKWILFAPCLEPLQPSSNHVEHRGLSYKIVLNPPRTTFQNRFSTEHQSSGIISWSAIFLEYVRCLLYLIMSVLGLLLLLQWLQLGSTVRVPLETSSTNVISITNASNSDYLLHTVAGFKALQQWYQPDKGTWGGWWTSANQLTTVADFAYINPTFRSSALRVFRNTFAKAPEHKVAQVKVNNATMVDTYTFPHIPAGLAAPPPGSNADWLNWFYDDEGWWALAWLKVYDITNESAYLGAAMDIFEDMVKGWGATCGGIWWNKAHEANVAISNELFLSVAAQLANRASNRAYYLDWAMKQYRWFYNSGLINANHNINDGLDLKTCKNNDGIVWSYNQGVILGALVELNRAQPDRFYLTIAQSIATAAISKLSGADGILHEPCEPDCGNDGPQFKGIFMRNLQVLQQATGNQQYREFINKNADSIWDNARGPGDKFDLVWSGPYKGASASTQSSALDALVAAVAIAQGQSAANGTVIALASS